MTIKCYLDTNIFLNVIYAEQPFFRSSEKLLEGVQEGKLSALTSAITETEISLDMDKTGNRGRIDQALRLIERMENLTISPLNSWTARMAARLVLDSGLTVHDAYHGATAIENEASVFVTRDRTLRDRLRKALKVSEPEAVKFS